MSLSIPALVRRAARAALLALTAGSAISTAPEAAPKPFHEFLRLDSFVLPIRDEASGVLWAFTPGAALVLEAQTTRTRHLSGGGYEGEITTVASTTKGWLLGTSTGVWEIRLNEGDLRFLPELEREGVYRFRDDLAFTEHRLYRLARPWERYAYDGFGFDDINDLLLRPDTLMVATDEGLRRFLWDRRKWDDERIGKHAKKEHVVRFLPSSQHNEIDMPDSSEVRTHPLLIGERRVYYEESGSREWIPIEGIEFPAFREAESDSAYRRIDRLLFRDLAQGASSAERWRRWLVAPRGVARVTLPDGGVPYQTARFRLEGDVRDTYVDSMFVWIATTEDLYVIDREFDNVDRFIDQKHTYVWGFLGVPTELRYDVTGEERGWFAISHEGMTEVFSGSWSWDAYGFDRFDVRDVLAAVPDIDGFWIGTRRGLRWFDGAKREWVPSRVPADLDRVPVFKLQWVGSDLYALTAAGIFSSTKQSLAWTKVAEY